MITHLSYPDGFSINDHINFKFGSVQYASFDSIVDMIYTIGQSALIAKRDLKSAYRSLPIRTEDFQLLGIKVDESYYIDKSLPMGLSQSANLFEKFSTFLHDLVVKRAGADTLAHVLNDFLFAGKQKSDTCFSLVSCMEQTCMELGIPIAKEKYVNPTTVMIFLGLEMNTQDMSVRFPYHRIQ